MNQWSGDIDDLGRHIYEAAAQLGPSIDPQVLAERVRALQRGLPAEDEFCVIAKWLGHCALVHKLDQHPTGTGKNYAIPDLLAITRVEEIELPVLVEVKATLKPKLSWTPAYFDGLKAYGAAVGLPVIVAWKYKSANIWSLFDIEAMVRNHQNLAISLEEALRANLMGLLLGDFAFSLEKGVGVHFKLQKGRLLQSEGSEETWEATVTDAFVTDGTGRRHSKINSPLLSLLLGSHLQDESVFLEDIVHQSFAVSDSAEIQFAHRALPALLAWRSDDQDQSSWRTYVSESPPVVTSEELRAQAEWGLANNFTHHILNIRPTKKPAWIPPS
jgi:Holliday junction resolvase